MTEQGMIRALGAMSGTSMDGVDAAIVVTDGRGIESFGPGGYRAYGDAERATLRAALGRYADPEDVAAAAEVVETAHAVLLSEFERPDLIGFHGQTLWHAPEDGQTCQTGDGSVLAEILDCPVVWDFRSTDMQMGGQGAPFAPFFHHACARWTGAQAPIAFLNLGGVGNLTWVDPRISAPEAPGALLAFDTGPANAPIDDLVAARTGARCDLDGALAARGRVAADLPERFLEHPYFAKMPPKSLDRDGFPDLQAMVADLSDADAAATLAAIVAASVMEGVGHCPSPPARLLVTGGGRKNPVLMKMIAAALDCPVDPVEAVGLDGDLLEAQAFAYLAVRVLYGLPTSAPGTTGIAAPVGGGRISRPQRGASSGKP
jgi:anhydro-N-acetylmuramic acid kinase